MVILGIDPGFARMGYGILEFRGEKILAAASGCAETAAGTEHASRLLMISDKLRAMIRKHKPAAIAVEKLFFSKNAKTAIAVGEVRGVILLAAAAAGIPVIEMTPLEVKQTVTGYGKADKRQVQEMVKVTLGLDTIPEPDDAADALAIAICGLRKFNCSAKGIV